MLYRMDKKPDWKVFLNMLAAAAVAPRLAKWNARRGEAARCSGYPSRPLLNKVRSPPLSSRLRPRVLPRLPLPMKTICCLRNPTVTAVDHGWTSVIYFVNIPPKRQLKSKRPHLHTARRS